MRKTTYGFITLLLLSLILMLLSSAEAQQKKYRTEEISGQVVDSETGTPIKGVVILAIWRIQATDEALEGKDITDIFLADIARTLCVQEAVTDKKGAYLIPSQGPFVIPEHWFLHESNPRVLMLKPGYKALVLDEAESNTVSEEVTKLTPYREPEEILALMKEYSHTHMVPIEDVKDELGYWVEEMHVVRIFINGLEAKDCENAREFLRAFAQERERLRSFIDATLSLKPELERYVNQKVRKR